MYETLVKNVQHTEHHYERDIIPVSVSAKFGLICNMYEGIGIGRVRTSSTETETPKYI